MAPVASPPEWKPSLITTAVAVALLLLVLAILIGNTMIAISFLRGRKDNLKGIGSRDDSAMEELHRRIENLTGKKG